MTSAAYATINLDAVKQNLKSVRVYAPNANIMAVIKANAYGHGLLRIVEALNEVDAVAVARINEAVTLRKAGFNKKIVILEGFVFEEELHELIQYDLDVTVHSFGQVDVLEKFTRNNKLSVWLKHDTGMNRLGFKTIEFASVYQRLLNCPCIRQPVFLMTHFSNADNISSSVTQEQIKLFTESVKGYPGEKSMANSAGIIGWPDSINDWVRPGIMLYGISPFNNRTANEIGIKPVMSLYSRLISVKTINQGEAVGYSETWVSEKKTRIGVVAIGYGDGYPRHAQTGTPVLVNGKRVSLVGRVSMDMITVDLNEQPVAKVGDPVTLWGDGLSVEEIAKYADTIPYTLLCGVTQRVEMKKV